MADFKVIPAAAGTGYVTIQDNGSSLPQETILNFVGGNVTVVDNPGAGSTDVTISTAATFPWTVVTTNTALVAINGYFANSASNLTFTLPATSGVGDVFSIASMNTGLFIIAQNAGQTIQYGNQVTTTGTGGNITSTHKGDGVTIVCNVANTGFQIMPGSIGGLNVT